MWVDSIKTNEIWGYRLPEDPESEANHWKIAFDNASAKLWEKEILEDKKLSSKEVRCGYLTGRNDDNRYIAQIWEIVGKMAHSGTNNFLLFTNFVHGSISGKSINELKQKFIEVYGYILRNLTNEEWLKGKL